MEKYEEALKLFINKMGYKTNENVIGIVLYGSHLTGYAHSKSDIDLHVIMRDNIDVLIRGASVDYDFKTEYFEKPLQDLYLSADNDFVSQNNAMVPIIGYGKILYDPTGVVKVLQGYILEKYKEPLPPLELDDAKEMAVIIANRISTLQVMYENDSPWFNHNYHKTIEKLRKFYSRKLGCPDIPDYKAEKLYSNENYRQAFCKSIIPDIEFIRLYFEAATCDGDNKEKMTYINAIYEYTTKDLNLDPNNYRIMIKSRNNPMNKIHE